MGATLVALFASATAQFNLPPGLLDSICYIESNHRPKVITEDDGGRSSLGICQLQLRTAKDLGYLGTERGLLGPGTNIFYAAKYLKHQYNRYRQWDLAVLAYNAGSYRTNLSGKPINQKYLDKVTKHYCGNTGNLEDVLTPKRRGREHNKAGTPLVCEYRISPAVNN